MSFNNAFFLICQWGMTMSHNSRVITIKSNNMCETVVQTKYQIFLCMLIFTVKVCLIVWNYHPSLLQHFGISPVTGENNISLISLSKFRALHISLATIVLTLFIKPVLNTYILFIVRDELCALLLVLFVRRNSNERQYQIAKHVRVYLQLKEIYSDIIQAESLAGRSQTKCPTSLGFVILYSGVYKTKPKNKSQTSSGFKAAPPRC